MTLTITLPNIEKGIKTSKDLIISILSFKGPLSAKKIYYQIKNKYAYRVTYQAIHKALQHLLKEGILIKKENEYMINLDWINQIKKFCDIIKTKYNKNIKKFSAEDIFDLVKIKDSVILNFDSLIDLDKFSLAVHNYFYPLLDKKDKNDIVCMLFKHQWWHIIYPQKEYKFEKKNKKFFMLCCKNTLLDEQGNKFKKKAGFNVKKVNFDLLHDINVYKNFIINIYYDSRLDMMMDNYFNKIKKLEDLNVPELIKTIFKKKSKICVIISQNNFVADQIRKTTLKYFKAKL